MNEFEWRRQLRDLRAPLEPPAELWSRIEARLDAPTAAQHLPAEAKAARRRRPIGWLAAAGFVGVCVLAGALQLHRQPKLPGMAAGPLDAATLNAAWQPGDPRFAGAAIELGSAQMELRQALQQAPQSAALQRLLRRTQHQETRLRQLERQLG